MSVQLGTMTLCSVYASMCRFTERGVLHFVTGHFMVYYTEPVAHMSPVGSLPLAQNAPKCLGLHWYIVSCKGVRMREVPQYWEAYTLGTSK